VRFGYRDSVVQQRAHRTPGRPEDTVVTVGGIDTYYDYDEKCWKYRRLGGGPVREQDCSIPTEIRAEETQPAVHGRRAKTGKARLAKAAGK
jgi:hypothetical protein